MVTRLVLTSKPPHTENGAYWIDGNCMPMANNIPIFLRRGGPQRNDEKNISVFPVSDYLIFSSFTDTTDCMTREKCEGPHKAETVSQFFLCSIPRWP